MAYYGVERGFNPGVYYSWPACRNQVNGFSRANFRKFDNEDDAWFFVHNGYVRQDSDGYSSSDGVSNSD
ncbi:Ribonuclease H1 [Candida tropicalis]